MTGASSEPPPGPKPAAAASPAETPTFAPYDFRVPRELPHERRAPLDTLLAAFAGGLASTLTAQLRQPAETRVALVEQKTVGEFTGQLQRPCALFIHRFDGSADARVGLDFTMALASRLIDRLFGGSGEPTDLKRALTPLDQRALQPLADRFISALQKAWSPYLTGTARPAGYESAPEGAVLGDPGTHVLVAAFDITFAGATDRVSVCLPLTTVRPFFELRPATAPATIATVTPARARDRAWADAGVRRASVSGRARFPLVRVPARDIGRLAIGQVMHTGLPVDTPVELHLSGRCRFVGTLGQSRGYLGFHVTRTASESGDTQPLKVIRGRVIDG